MKTAGLILITIGFLAGAYLSVLDAEIVNTTGLLAALAIGATGVYFFSSGKKEEATHEDRVSSDLDAITSSLDNLAEKTGIINAEKHNLYTYDVCHRLDADLIDHLNDFVESRKTISTVYGLDVYAEVMNHYAAGERYLNRVWSASADGYIDEVNDYLEKAWEQFKTTRDILNQKKAGDGRV